MEGIASPWSPLLVNPPLFIRPYAMRTTKIARRNDTASPEPPCTCSACVTCGSLMNLPPFPCSVQRWWADRCSVTDPAEGVAGPHRLAAARADVRPQMGWRRRPRDNVVRARGRRGRGRRRPHVRRARRRPRWRGGGGRVVVRRPCDRRRGLRGRRRPVCRPVVVVGGVLVVRRLPEQPRQPRTRARPLQARARLEPTGTGRADGRGRPQRLQSPARAGQRYGQRTSDLCFLVDF